MLRSLSRWGVVVAFLFVSFSHPVQALPFGAGERESSFGVALSEIWSWLIAPFSGEENSTPFDSSIIPAPDPGDPLQGRGTCDPNGGIWPCPTDNDG